MARWLVQYDVTSYEEESYENEDGETIYEDYVDQYSEDQEVEADSEEEAREIVKDSLWSYDDVNIWNVEKVEE